nr:pantoate--beta-alanine ligase [Saprospiraceae bacterium]
MGMKDFQQVAVVQKLIEDLELTVEMVPCDTVRKADGLAMRSRNLRLDPEMRKKASVLFDTLQKAKIWILKFTPEQVSQMAIEKIRQKGLKPEYFELVDPQSLLPICEVNKPMEVVACVAAYAGAVRLIDNMVLKA